MTFSRSIRVSIALILGTSAALTAQLPSPPTIAKGTAPGGDVRSMSNNQTSLASLADGTIAAVIYKQSSPTSGGHLTIAVTADQGNLDDEVQAQALAAEEIGDERPARLAVETLCGAL